MKILELRDAKNRKSAFFIVKDYKTPIEIITKNKLLKKFLERGLISEGGTSIVKPDNPIEYIKALKVAFKTPYAFIQVRKLKSN